MGKQVGARAFSVVQRSRCDALRASPMYASNSIDTTTALRSDDLRRLRNLTTSRASLPSTVSAGRGQMLLQDEQYEYDLGASTKRASLGAILPGKDFKQPPTGVCGGVGPGVGGGGASIIGTATWGEIWNTIRGLGTTVP